MSGYETAREIDALVAERVMGWQDVVNNNHAVAVTGIAPWAMDRYGKADVRDFVPHWSTDIKQAWLVVEAIRERGLTVDLRCLPDGFACGIEAESGAVNEHYIATADADTAPLAICRASLEALAPDSAVSGGPTVREEAQP